jgi:hypothetical protein
MLCEFAIEVRNGVEIYLLCSKTNLPCAFQRYCIINNCMKMIDGWENCNMNK